MRTYKISFAIDGVGRSKKFIAESDGEAIEMFEAWAEGFDPEIEFLSIKEEV